MKKLQVVIGEGLSNNFLLPHMECLPHYLMNISPENESSMCEVLGSDITINFTAEGSFVIESSFESRTINISIGALARLWGFSFATYAIMVEHVMGRSLDDPSMQYQKFDENNPLTRAAIDSIEVAAKHEDLCLTDYDKLKNIKRVWENDDTLMVSEEMFRMSISYICIHEIAHIVLKHDPLAPNTISIQNEKEADRWAYDHILSLISEYDESFTFFKRLIGIACAHLFMVFLKIMTHEGHFPFEEERYPAAYDRLFWALDTYLRDNDKNDQVWGYVYAGLSIMTSNYEHSQVEASEPFDSFYDAVQAFLDKFAE